jgi:DNA-binding transcriptional LysR family regulator
MAESLRDIRFFVAVYEERSFTAAAARENATQPGVSQHIRKLEERLGVTLFSRDGAVRATPAGNAYYRGCIEVLRAHEEAGQRLRGFGTGLAGEIVVGLMPTITRCALAPALARFMDVHPNVAVRVVEAFSGILIEHVRAGELAFAIVPPVLGEAGLRSRLFLRTPEVLVSGNASRLPHLAPVRLASLGPLKLVVPGHANARRDRIETYLASGGVPIERRLELDSMFGALDFVAGTDWVTILPGTMMVSDIERRQFTINPLADPPLALDLVLIEPSRRPLAPAAEAFLEILRAESTRLNDRWTRFAPGDLPRRPRKRSR